MKTGKVIIDIVAAISMAVLFVSAIFLVEIISASVESIYPEFVFVGLVAIVYGFELVSNDTKRSLLRFGMSIPFSYLVLQFFWRTDYLIRSLNWVIPEYGRHQSGGAAFVGAFRFFIQIAACFVMGCIGLGLNKRDYVVPEKVQVVVSICVTMALILIVVTLEKRFPSIQEVFS